MRIFIFTGVSLVIFFVALCFSFYIFLGMISFFSSHDVSEEEIVFLETLDAELNSGKKIIPLKEIITGKWSARIGAANGGIFGDDPDVNYWEIEFYNKKEILEVWFKKEKYGNNFLPGSKAFYEVNMETAYFVSRGKIPCSQGSGLLDCYDISIVPSSK